jgi:hypothetical protein
MSRNTARPQPQRGVLFQPWVHASQRIPSPEGAAQLDSPNIRERNVDWRGDLFRPFRACFDFNVIPRALPWAGLWPPRWGFGMAKLDALVGKAAEAVERLQEYRTALITAAVTGKIDVRGSIATSQPKQVMSASP